MQKERHKFKKYYLGMKPRLFIGITGTLLFLFLSILFLIKTLNLATLHQLFYSENSNLDYKVCLKSNEFFSEECLDKNLQYVANIIDYIAAEFKYNLTASDYFSYEASYLITSKIIASEKNDPNKILFSKEDIIVPEKRITETHANSLIIKEILNIDYNLYNELMTSFRKNYTLTLDSKVIITLHVNVKGTYEGIAEEIKVERDISLSIPLSEQTLGISMDYNDINDSKLIESNKAPKMNRIIFYVLSSISIIVTLIIIYKLLKFVLKITKTKSLYEKKLNKLLREYDQIIIKAKDIIIKPSDNLIKVDSFEELLDVHFTISKPILFMKINNYKALFVINGNNETYRYVFKEVDIDKSKSKRLKDGRK